MNKKLKSLIIVYFVVFIIFNVCYFFVPFHKGEASWCVYIFSILAIIVGFVSTYLAFVGEKNLSSKLYGFPLFRIGYLYLIVQLLFSILIFVIDSYIPVATWISVVVSVCFLGLAVIGLVITDNTRDIIEEQEIQDDSCVKKMACFRGNVEKLEDLCQSEELKEKVLHFIEEIKYSDPVSSEELVEIEDELKFEIEKLSGMLADNKNIEAETQLQEVRSLLRERNRKCKAYKK